MGARRDDITSVQRTQITIEVLSPYRPWGAVSRLAREYRVTRTAIYDIAAAGKHVLVMGLTPGPHGPVPSDQSVCVDRERLVRSTVVLTEAGVSQRDASFCLEEMLDTRLSPSWVNAELAKADAAAAEINRQWQPAVVETLTGDEIYSNGLPNLLVVGNDSLYIYALTRQPRCDGETWGRILQALPESPLFSSDAGSGLAAGVQMAGLATHQIDWDHLLRPLWGQVARLEEQAYAALSAVEEREARFDQAHTVRRLEQHWAAWERLRCEAEEKVERCQAFEQIARQVDHWFALIDLESGQLRDPVAGAESLCQLGMELQNWNGTIYKKLSGYLTNLAEGLFCYQVVLAQALTPLVERWGDEAIRCLSRIWQIEADEKRHPLPLVERAARKAKWGENLERAWALLGEEQLWEAWNALSQVLEHSWRGSMLTECVNSLLRPVLRVGHGDPPCSDFRNMSGTWSEPDSVLSEHDISGVPLNRNTVGA